MGLETAAILGIASLAVSVGTTTASFVKAGSQRKKGLKAQAEADRIAEKIRGDLDKNFYENLSVNKEAAEMAREALLVQGATATDAIIESDRGPASGVGRVLAAQNQGQQGIRVGQVDEKLKLDKLIAEEESRLRDIGTQLDLGEIAGAQQAVADAEKARNQAVQQGIGGVASTAMQAVQVGVPLYNKSQAAKGYQDAAKTATAQGVDLTDVIQNNSTALAAQGVDVSGAQGLTGDALQDWMQTNLTRDMMKDLSFTAPSKNPTPLNVNNPANIVGSNPILQAANNARAIQRQRESTAVRDFNTAMNAMNMPYLGQNSIPAYGAQPLQFGNQFQFQPNPFFPNANAFPQVMPPAYGLQPNMGGSSFGY
tara:strand:+ start:2418 stop:3521 length:1104 start_codon:yes stop_codon:yes gene_type:complete